MKKQIAGLFILPLLTSCEVEGNHYQHPQLERPLQQVEIIRHHTRPPVVVVPPRNRSPVPPVVIVPPQDRLSTTPQGYDEPRVRQPRRIEVQPQVQIEKHADYNHSQPQVQAQVQVIPPPQTQRAPAPEEATHPKLEQITRSNSTGSFNGRRQVQTHPFQITSAAQPKPPVHKTESTPVQIIAPEGK